MRRVTTALFILAAISIAAAAVLLVPRTGWWCWACIAIAEYNARVHSRLMGHDVTLDLLTFAGTACGISIAECG